MEDEKKLNLEGNPEEEKEEVIAPTDENSPADDTSAPENPENPVSDDLGGDEPVSENPDSNEMVADEPAIGEPAMDEAPAEAEASVETVENESASSQENDLNHKLTEENGAIDTSIKTFTQDDVDKLVGDTRVRTREKTFRYIYDRYGVKSEEELDNLFANAQRYDTQKEMYDADKKAWETEKSENDKRLSDMSEQIALMQSEISPDRYEDAKLILRGKGLDVTLENISNELATHPEWKKEDKAAEKPAEPEKPTMRIKTLGNEKKPEPVVSEEEQAQKLFKMKW